MDVKNSPTKISTHAPLAGRDLSLFPVSKGSQAFQPTRPLRGATVLVFITTVTWIKFQPTRPLRGATHHLSPPSQRPRNFNPRAPCGARRSILNGCGVWTHFNPRAPCGARQNVSPNQSIIAVFQPTRPLRGATILILPPALLVFYFNPRAPCGARPESETAN